MAFTPEAAAVNDTDGDPLLTLVDAVVTALGVTCLTNVSHRIADRFADDPRA